MLFISQSVFCIFLHIFKSIQRKNEGNFVAYFQISVVDIFKWLNLMREILCCVRFVYEVLCQQICRLSLVASRLRGPSNRPVLHSLSKFNLISISIHLR